MGYRHSLYFIKKEEVEKLKKLNWDDNWDEIEDILNKYPSMMLGKMYYGNSLEFINKALCNTTNLIPNEDITCELVNENYDILKALQDMCIANYNLYYEEADQAENKDEWMKNEFEQTMKSDKWMFNNSEFGWPTYKDQWYQCEVLKQFMKLGDYCIVVYGG